MTERSHTKPRVGISACLLGDKVRYDGSHKRDRFLTESLGPHVEFFPVCPELEVGMGVPREPVRLIGESNNPKMIAERSGTDWTPRMTTFAAQRVQALRAANLTGYILKKDSPSCGMERVRIYNDKGSPTRQGRGLFAATLTRYCPLLPVEEEGRLHDPSLRGNFIERLFAYHRWQQLGLQAKSVRALVQFHSRHKFLCLAHSEEHFRQLGRLVANPQRLAVPALYDHYGRLFMAGLKVRATTKKHANVLDHMMGFFSRQLPKEERKEMIELISDFRRRLVPLVVPLTMFRHYVRKYQVSYLGQQAYLEPSPKELMIRNQM